jgi:biopolymer transport protein ExbB/TolQ
MNSLNRLKELINSCEEDYYKVKEKGLKTASVRIRRTMLDIKKAAQEVRQEMADHINAISTVASQDESNTELPF